MREGHCRNSVRLPMCQRLRVLLVAFVVVSFLGTGAADPPLVLPAWRLLGAVPAGDAVSYQDGRGSAWLRCETIAGEGGAGYRLVGPDGTALAAAMGLAPHEAVAACRAIARNAAGAGRTLGEGTLQAPAPGLYAAAFPVASAGRPAGQMAVALHSRMLFTPPPPALLELEARLRPPLRPAPAGGDPERHRYLPVASLPLWVSDEATAGLMLFRYWEAKGRFPLSRRTRQTPTPAVDDTRALAIELSSAACGCSFPEAIERFAEKRGRFVLTTLRVRVGVKPLTWEEYCAVIDAGEPALVTLQGGTLKRTFVACGYAVGAPGRFMALQAPAPPGEEPPADPRQSAMLIRWDGGYGQLEMLRVSPPETKDQGPGTRDQRPRTGGR